MSSNEQQSNQSSNFKKNVVFLWIGLIACIGISSMSSGSSDSTSTPSENVSNEVVSNDNSSSDNTSNSEEEKEVEEEVSSEVEEVKENISSVITEIPDAVNVEQILAEELTEEEIISLNYILKYKLPDNFREGYDLQSAAEIVLVNEIQQESIIGDLITSSEFSIEEFFMAHDDISDIFEGAEISVILDETTKVDDKTITSKLQLVDSAEQAFYYTINTIVFDSHPDQYLGFTGVLNREDPHDLILEFIESVKHTSIDLNSIRTFKPTNESPQVTLTENWRKYTNSNAHIYFKYDELKYMEMVVETGEEGLTADEFFESTKEFLDVVPDMVLYAEDEYEVEDRTITSKVYQMTTDFSDFYEYFTFIEDPNSSIPVIVSISLETLITFEELQAELQSIINAVKF
ncbi:MAG: hypothetical protein R3Y29_01805 [bacterium]